MKMNFLAETVQVGPLKIDIYGHPQGCRSYIITDDVSQESLVLDLHLDFLVTISEKYDNIKYVFDTHTHADHPSGSAELSKISNCERIVHQKAQHKGVEHFVQDGDQLELGESKLKVVDLPGHTPDSMGLAVDGALFTGDSLFIESVARTDFIGGDAGVLFDSLQKIKSNFAEDTIIFPSHDYDQKYKSTLQAELENNPWLKIADRDLFIKSLTANPPPRPANMDFLLGYNRDQTPFAEEISAAETAELVRKGGAMSIIDVRTSVEYESEHIQGSNLMTLDKLKAEEAMAVAPPRLILCRSGARAEMAKRQLQKNNVRGLVIITGGISAYIAAGGDIVKGKAIMSLERQVRIAAGSLVLIGVLGAWLISPIFIALSAFVGAGLVFAGLTDSCGMGMILSKMPWNQGSSKTVTGGNCAAKLPTAGGNCAAKLPASGGNCAAKLPESDD